MQLGAYTVKKVVWSGLVVVTNCTVYKHQHFLLEQKHHHYSHTHIIYI